MMEKLGKTKRKSCLMLGHTRQRCHPKYFEKQPEGHPTARGTFSTDLSSRKTQLMTLMGWNRGIQTSNNLEFVITI